jgi:hypothetical protein
VIGPSVLLACGDCAPSHLPPESHPLMVFLLVAALTVIGGVIVVWQLRRRRRPRQVTDQWGALAVMGDLCPGGWAAEIRLQGRQTAPSGDVVAGTPTIALRWKLYEDGGRCVAVTREVRSETIGQALQMMVEDRRLDVTLEQIESAVESENSGGRSRR